MSQSVAIFWDYENCALPALEPSFTIVNEIRRLAHRYGSVKSFKAYLEYQEQMSVKSMSLRSELQSCGVSLIDCPHNGRKDVADKMILVDMMAHAIDTPPPATIILISGDRDFVYAVSILSLRQYRVVLLAPRAAHTSLKTQAYNVYNWPDDFLPELPPDTPASCAGPSIGRPIESGSATQEDDGKREYATPPSSDNASSSPADALAETKPFETTIDNAGDGAAVEPPLDDDQVQSPVLENLGKSEYEVRSGTVNAQNSITAARDPGSNAPLSRTRSWASFARHPTRSDTIPPFPAIYRPTTPELRHAIAPTSTGFPALGSLNALASACTLTSPPTSPSKSQDRDDGDGDATWQTYARAAKRRVPGPTALSPEFRPLVKVLKRQLAEGVVRVESSQLGQYLSQEVQRLAVIYERAGVARLKEYTALAAEHGIVTVSREAADGHNYVALHPVYRRSGMARVEHVWVSQATMYNLFESMRVSRFLENVRLYHTTFLLFSCLTRYCFRICDLAGNELLIKLDEPIHIMDDSG